MRGKELRGSFTVEAAFIMPVILAVIFSLLYMSLILHDKVILQSVADEAVVRCNQLYHQPCDVMTSEIYYSKLLDISLLGESADKHREELMYYINQESAGKLFLCNIEDIQVDLQEDSCGIRIEAASKISLPLVFNLLKDNAAVTVSQQRQYHNPEQFARQAENILGTVTEIKGMEQVTGFLSKVAGYLGKQ